ncbi:hypothetical protein P5Y53_13740 [Dyella jiangningensis]|uniref:hypothetical protein n=1 Tax=Dyella jiangningensis TaxID=1379159 RepID=UPI00240FF89C|nr:hypothetical protein [Dyella jiangningensis]MDG2538732.1 hypothetical protein [Dyella jiangningensis]
MGRHSKADVQRIGPKLWARFLKRHFKCSDLAPLNAQLLFPVAPFEIFEFGENPLPLPLRVAPKIFERSYDLGRSPDGLYTPEVHGPNVRSNQTLRYNLYQRVMQRVPESKYWLLKEIEPFLQGTLPPIDETTRLLNELLVDLGLVLVEGEAVAAWELLDSAGAQTAELASVHALSNAELPEYVALAFTLCHLCVWREPPRKEDRLSNGLLSWCRFMAVAFASFLESHDFDLDAGMYSDLVVSLMSGIAAIAKNGARSMNINGQIRPPNLIGRLILVPDTAAIRQSICCLTEAIELQGSMRHSWPEYGFHLDEPLEDEQNRTTDLDPAQAMRRLSEAAGLVPQQLRTRARRMLSGYRCDTTIGANPVANPAFVTHLFEALPK